MVAGALLLTAFSASKQSVPVLDGVEPSTRTDAAYAFRCGGVISRLGYRQERRDTNDVAKLADAWT